MIALAAPIDIEDHQALARYFAGKFGHYGTGEHEAAFQDSLLALWRATKTYQPEHGAFSTYASFWARHVLQRHIKSPYAMPVGLKSVDLKGRAWRSPSKGLQDHFAVDTLFDQPACASDCGCLDDRDEVAYILSRLSVRKRRIIQCVFIDGLDLTETGKILGISRERVRQQKEEALEEMRKRLLLTYAELK